MEIGKYSVNFKIVLKKTWKTAKIPKFWIFFLRRFELLVDQKIWIHQKAQCYLAKKKKIAEDKDHLKLKERESKCVVEAENKKRKSVTRG